MKKWATSSHRIPRAVCTAPAVPGVPARALESSAVVTANAREKASRVGPKRVIFCESDDPATEQLFDLCSPQRHKNHRAKLRRIEEGHATARLRRRTSASGLTCSLLFTPRCLAPQPAQSGRICRVAPLLRGHTPLTAAAVQKWGAPAPVPLPPEPEKCERHIESMLFQRTRTCETHLAYPDDQD